MHRTTAELQAHLDVLRAAPRGVGSLEMVVRRPVVNERELLDEGRLDVDYGLIGDSWLDRSTSHAIEAGTHLNSQINVMSARMVRFLAPSVEEQVLAGDQLFFDLDISKTHLPAGTQLAIGDEAVIEVSQKPHNGCSKFRARFGDEALAFVNSEEGQELRLRGFNARVITSGTVRPGDKVRVL